MAEHENGRNADRDDAAPSGPPPKSHEHAHGENMTNGVPDDSHGAEATGLPHGDREAAERAAGQDRKDD